MMSRFECVRLKWKCLYLILAILNLYLLKDVLGYDGIGFFLISYAVISLFTVLSASGISGNIGKLIRLRVMKEQYRSTSVIRKAAFLLQLVTGILITLIAFGIAGELFLNFLNVPCSYSVYLFLLPSVFIKALDVTLEGYIIGCAREKFLIISGLVRQLLILVLSLPLTRRVGSYGTRVSALLGDDVYTAMYGAIGLAAAIVVANLIVILMHLVYFCLSLRTERAKNIDGFKQQDSFLKVISLLLSGRWSSVLTGIVLLVPFFAGFIILAKQSEELAVTVSEFGIMIYCLLLPACLCIAFHIQRVISVIIKATACKKKKDIKTARQSFANGIHISMARAVFCSVFLVFMSTTISSLAGDTAIEPSRLFLKSGAWLIIILTAAIYFGLNLMTAGKGLQVFLVSCVCDILYLFLAVLFVKTQAMNGLIIAFEIAGAVGLVIMGYLCIRAYAQSLDPITHLVFPVIAALVSGIVCILTSRMLTPHIGEAVTLFVSFILSGIVYWATLLLLRGFSAGELKDIPGGTLLINLGRLLRAL